MEILNWKDVVLESYTKSNRIFAMTIGVFDGIHKGHQILLDSIFKKNDLAPIVITFECVLNYFPIDFGVYCAQSRSSRNFDEDDDWRISVGLSLFLRI